MGDVSTSVQDLIDLWPSLADFAGDAGVEIGAAKQMRRRSSIAPGYWVAVVAGAKQRGISGVTFESLGKAHARSSADPGGPPSERSGTATPPAAVPTKLAGGVL